MTLPEIKAAAEAAGLTVADYCGVLTISTAHDVVAWFYHPRDTMITGGIDLKFLPSILRLLAGEQCAFFNNVGRLPVLPYPTEDK